MCLFIGFDDWQPVFPSVAACRLHTSQVHRAEKVTDLLKKFPPLRVACHLPVRRDALPMPENCPNCGTQLPPDAPRGLCPSCLFLSLESTGSDADLSNSGTGDQTDSKAPDAPPPPAIIGAYTIREVLGSGGWGVVYRAEQEQPIRREVAVKLIRPGMASSEVLRRFLRERRELARMEHPHIATVLEAGSLEDGRPYFVMELVRGLPLTDYCDLHNLDIPARLRLFAAVCGAVQHAHQKSLVHRDLKPSNILVTEVDGKPVPKVIDFGIAKALDETGEEDQISQRTVAGRVMGTPLYMSPEQAGGDRDIDTRTDIFSLGVILFELLAGSTPHAPRGSMSEEKWRQKLCTEDAPRPSSTLTPVTEAVRVIASHRSEEPARLARMLRGDLDWITLKALEKQQDRRYGTVAALAADLLRHLQHERVEAGRPGVYYRIRKFIRRNRMAVGSAAALVALLGAGVAVSTWQWREARTAEGHSRRAEQTARNYLGNIHGFLLQQIREALSLGDYQKALALISEAERSAHPATGELFFSRIEALEGLNDPSARELVKTLVPDGLLPAQRAQLAYWQAERLLQNGESEQGRQLMETAIATGLPPLEQTLAAAALSSTVGEALRHYSEGVRLAPMRASLQRNYALALLLSGRVQETRDRIRICHSLFPADGNFSVLEVLLECLQGNADASVAAGKNIPDELGEAQQFFRNVARPLALHCREIVRMMSGAEANLGMADQLKMVGALAGSWRLVRDAEIPGLTGTPPLLTRGLRSLILSIFKVGMKNMNGAAEEVREAVKYSDEGTLWLLLGVLEFQLDHRAAAVEAFQKARSTPALMGQVHEVAELFTGVMEALAFSENGDEAPLQRAGQGFEKFLATGMDVPQAAVPLMRSVGLRLEDKKMARMLAWRMPAGSREQLTLQAEIELSERNTAKALELAQKAQRQAPDDAGLIELLRRITTTAAAAHKAAGGPGSPDTRSDHQGTSR